MPIPESGGWALPPGLHECALEELVQRFGHGSPTRTELGTLLNAFLPNAVEAGARYALVGGSFLTRDEEPKDVDLVLVFASREAIPGQLICERLGGLFLDISYTAEDDPDQIAALLSLLGRNRQEEPQGVVRVNLVDGELPPIEERDLQDDVLRAVRATYFHRSIQRVQSKRGVLITLHGLRSDGRWSAVVSRRASTQGWVVAPFHYGRAGLGALFSERRRRKILNRFRDWLLMVSEQERLPVSAIAHSFGTYVLVRYLTAFNPPPVRLSAAVLTGCILNSELDWPNIGEGRVRKVLNEVAPTDAWVGLMPLVGRLSRQTLFGRAGTVGFSRPGDVVTQAETEIFDHNNVIREDVISRRWMPFLNAHRLAP